MALNDLLKGFKRMALRGALGLALVSPMVQGCGDEGSDDGNEPEYCYSDYDCHGDRYCGNDGKCHFLENGNGSNGGYTCQNACQKLIDCCKIVTGDPAIDCEESDTSPTALNSCIYDCQNDSWSQSTLDCLGVLYCNNAQDVKKCGGKDF